MKKLMIPLFCILILSGCWNYQDTDKRLIVAGASIDLGENGETLVTAETVTFSVGENKPESNLISGSGSSVSDAFNDILKKSGKELYWQHATVIILGADYARRGILELLDYILNDYEMRYSLNLAVSGLEKGSDVFEMDIGDNEISCFAAASLLEEGDKLGYCIREYAYDTLNVYAENLKDFALPLLVSGENGVMEASGCAAFHGDKMVGTFSSVESQYLQMVRGTLHSMELQIDTDEIKSSVNIASPKVRVRAKVADNTILATVDMKADYEVLMSIENPPMEKNERMELIRGMVENQLVRGMEDTNAHFRAIGADLFGWGEKIFRRYPDEYDKLSGSGSFSAPVKLTFMPRLSSRIEGVAGSTINQEGG